MRRYCILLRRIPPVEAEVDHHLVDHHLVDHQAEEDHQAEDHQVEDRQVEDDQTENHQVGDDGHRRRTALLAGLVFQPGRRPHHKVPEPGR